MAKNPPVNESLTVCLIREGSLGAYRVLGLILWPLLTGYWLWKSRFDPDYRRHWAERFGGTGRRDDHPLWIHAVSVGEYRASQKLLDALSHDFPLHLTVTTPTARRLAEGHSPLSYAPLDSDWAIHRFLDRVRPRGLVLIETELWPLWLRECERRNLPIFLINGRLSARSARRYAHTKWLWQGWLRNVVIGAQNRSSARRFRLLGAKNVEITGNLKYDGLSIPFQAGRNFREKWGNQRPVWLFASIHPAEWQILHPGLLRLFRKFSDLLVIIVPRHPVKMVDLIKNSLPDEIKCIRRTVGQIDRETQILLVDTIGELPIFFAASDGALIGGSLCDHGGQNPLEGAACGIPLLMGPSRHNFPDICQNLLRMGILRTVNGDNWADFAIECLQTPYCHTDRIMAAEQGLLRQQGATARNYDLICRTMDQAHRWSCTNNCS